MPDTSHLVALQSRLSSERQRLASAQTSGEREMRAVWVAGIEKEIAQELAFLGMDCSPLPELTNDELLAELQ